MNLESIAQQSVPADLVIVGPTSSSHLREIATQFQAQLLPDPGSLPAAINLGASVAQEHHEFLNWLGDDDLLESGSLATTSAALDLNPAAVCAFGACRYIDEKGNELWVSKAGKWAPRILSWGPDLIPQPGMLVRTSAWRAVHGLDESYRFAFDLDLLLKLKKQGQLVPVPSIVASFRWHGDSLTVGDRSTNLRESERAKRDALSPVARKMAWMWEPIVRAATRVAAREVSRRAGRHQIESQATSDE